MSLRWSRTTFSSSFSGPVSDVVRWGTMAWDLTTPGEGQFTRFAMLESAALPAPLPCGRKMVSMSPTHALSATVLLLVASNVFMTFAWYGHLKYVQAAPWYTAAVASWAIALFEYLLQVPANRIGFE